ncbi:hypothetical protein G6F43_011679 [Rhizopus delemar]|nr:hypothetical protein G6F43_011679 [Rhizopus delemar]
MQIKHWSIPVTAIISRIIHPNHNIELIDDYEYGVPALRYREIQYTNMSVYKSNDHTILAINQLATMDTSKGYPSQQHGNRIITDFSKFTTINKLWRLINSRI